MKTLFALVFLSLFGNFIHAEVPPVEVPLSAATLGRAPGVQEYPRIAVSDRGAFVAWQDYRGNGDVYGTRIDREGRPLDPLGIRLSTMKLGPAGITAFGPDYLVALTTPCDAITIVRVTSEGVVSPEQLIGNSRGQCIGSVGMASNNHTALVAWPQGDAVLLDHAGEVVTRFPLGPAESVAVSTNGTDYLLATLTRTGPSMELAVQRVSGTGKAGERHLIGPVGDIAAVALASNGSDYIVAATGTSLRTQIIGPNGAPAAPPQLFAVDRGTTAIGAAWDGAEYVVAFAQFDNASWKYSLFAARYDGDGHRTAVEPIANVTQNVPFPNFTLGSSAAFGSFVAWADDSEVFLARTSGGAFAPVLLSVAASSQVRPQIVRAGDQFVAVWRENSPEGESTLLRAAVVGSDLVPRGEPRDIAAIADGSHHVVASATAVVITWTRHFSGATLFAQRFTPDLEPIDPAPVVVATQVRHSTHAVAVSEQQALIVWNETTSDVLYASALTINAAIPPSARFALPELPFGAHSPAVAWNGREFLVAWAQARGFPPSQGLHPDPPDDVLMVRVSVFGSMIDSAPATIESNSQHIGSISLVSNGGDAWIAWRSTNGFMGRRIGANGKPIGPAVTLLSRDIDIETAMLVAAGDRYLVAWDARTGVYQRRIGIRAVTGDWSRATGSLPEREIAWGSFSVAAGAFGIVAAYDRIAPEAPYGGTSRVFVRGLSQPQPRRRAVRFAKGVSELRGPTLARPFAVSDGPPPGAAGLGDRAEGVGVVADHEPPPVPVE